MLACNSAVPDLSCHLPRFEAVMRDFPALNIVISSTWRTQFNLDVLRVRFSEDIASPIAGVTPHLAANGPNLVEQREAEILVWLLANDRQDQPWIALDDAFWEFKHHRNRVVVCKSFIGLDESAECKLRTMLGSASFASSSREP